MIRILSIIILFASTAWTQDMADGIIALGKKLADNPDDDAVRFELAQQYYKMGGNEEVIRLYEKKFSRSAAQPAEYKLYAAARLKTFEYSNAMVKDFTRWFGADEKIKLAEIALEKSLSINPQDPQAYFLLGMAKYFRTNYDESEVYFKQALSYGMSFETFGFSDASVQLATVLRTLKKFDEAIPLLQGRDDATMELFAIYLEQGNETKASELYYQLNNEAKDDEKVEHLFLDASPIASSEETKEWLNLKTQDEKKKFISRFWKQRDPNIFTPTNERLTEHYRRLQYTRTFFAKPGIPGYDDRGLIYIRMGKPDRVFYGGDGMIMKDNESWIYDNGDKVLIYDFVSQYGQYVLGNLADAIGPGLTSVAQLGALQGMYSERAIFNPYYERMALRMKALQNNLSANPGGASYARYQQELSLLKQNLLTEQYARNYEKDNTQRFFMRSDVPEIPINVKFASFKDVDGQSRLDFYFMTPFSYLNFKSNPFEQNLLASNVTAKAKIFDNDYNEVGKIEREYLLSSTPMDVAVRSLLDEFRITLKPGKYHVAIQLENNLAEKIGSYQFEAMVRDYSQDELMVSDLQMALRVDENADPGKFVKPNTRLRVVPNPAALIVKKNPMAVYYDIYNLTLDNNGHSSYEVAYTVKTLNEKKGLVLAIARLFTGKKRTSLSSVTQKQGESTMQREYIGLDISDLPEGAAQLEVKVKDLLAGKETVSTIPLNLTSG
ncbi:GWxTD domain-containing protein, partial [bacterium]|nr:GWxTD domain-containing protein [bacterium]